MSKSDNRKLLRKVLWPGDKGIFDINHPEILSVLESQREINTSSGRYKSGSFYSDKSLRTIEHESGSERDFYLSLETDPAVAYYWHQPVKLRYYRGKHPAHHYPDAGILLHSGHFIIAEVKPLSGMLDHRTQIRAEAALEYCSRKGFGYLLTDGRHTPADLLTGKVNRKLEKLLLSALEVDTVRQAQYKEIKELSNAKPSELYRAIIRLNLKYRDFPFQLSRGNQSPVFRGVYFGKRKYDDVVAYNFNSLFDRPP